MNQNSESGLALGLHKQISYQHKAKTQTCLSSELESDHFLVSCTVMGAKESETAELDSFDFVRGQGHGHTLIYNKPLHRSITLSEEKGLQA